MCWDDENTVLNTHGGRGGKNNGTVGFNFWFWATLNPLYSDPSFRRLLARFWLLFRYSGGSLRSLFRVPFMKPMMRNVHIFSVIPGR